MSSRKQTDALTLKYPNGVERADSLLISQFNESLNLHKYVECFTIVFNDILQACTQVATERYLDYAVGAQLDVIGTIVGQPRTLSGGKPLGYFGYHDNAQAADPSIGTDEDPIIGGMFKGDMDRDSADFVLTDPAYYNVIRAKILKNSSNCSVDDICTYVDLILGKETDLEIIESETENAAHLRIHEKLSMTSKATLSSLIKQMKVGGVRYTMEDDGGIIDINADGPSILR